MPKTNPEFDAFTRLVDNVLAVPHDVIKQRVEEHKRQAAKNPSKPGPKGKKRKATSASSGRASKS